jgi:hypothetical protein
MYGPLSNTEIKCITNGYLDPSTSTFIETGTYVGWTTLVASDLFQTVHTVELSPLLVEQASIRCKGRTNITFHIGDSLQVLPIILPPSGDVVVFLDAHQSGSDTCNNGTWVPLMDELRIISEWVKTRKDATVVIIDDVRLFNAHWDWAGITVQSVREMLHADESYVQNDRMNLIIKSQRQAIA